MWQMSTYEHWLAASIHDEKSTNGPPPSNTALTLFHGNFEAIARFHSLSTVLHMAPVFYAVSERETGPSGSASRLRDSLSTERTMEYVAFTWHALDQGKVCAKLEVTQAGLAAEKADR